MAALQDWRTRLRSQLERGLDAIPLIGGPRLIAYEAAPGSADLVVCSWLDACERAAAFDAVISIESPDATPDNGRLRRFIEPDEPAHKVLCFHDIDDPRLPAPPRRRHVREGLLFARQHAGRRLLIHCHAGVSRSTALAYAILIDHHRAIGDERRMLDHLVALRPQACPNRLMVRYADQLLGCRGRMIQAVEEHPVIQETRRRNFSPPEPPLSAP
jgi:predicted protein tyrosine phosphatase